MDTKQVQNLPLNGRNPLALLTLEPGVLQRTNGGVQIPMLLLQAHERRAKLAFFVFGHRRGAAGFRSSGKAARPSPGFRDALPQKGRSNRERPA